MVNLSMTNAPKHRGKEKFSPQQFGERITDKPDSLLLWPRDCKVRLDLLSLLLSGCSQIQYIQHDCNSKQA